MNFEIWGYKRNAPLEELQFSRDTGDSMGSFHHKHVLVKPAVVVGMDN